MDEIIELYRRDLDKTLIDQSLKLTVEERFVRLMAMQRLAEELRAAGERLREPKP